MNVDKTEQDNVDNFLKNPSLNFQMIDRLINDIERKEIDKSYNIRNNVR